MHTTKKKKKSEILENEEQAKRDPGVVGRNPRIVAKEGALGMEIVPRKQTIAIFGGMLIAILVVVRIVLRNQRGRVAVALHQRRSGSIPIAMSNVDLWTSSSTTHDSAASNFLCFFQVTAVRF